MILERDGPRPLPLFVSPVSSIESGIVREGGGGGGGFREGKGRASDKMNRFVRTY